MLMTKKEERQKILERTGGRCAYCGCQLSMGWHADHMEPVERLTKYDHDKRKYVYEGIMRKPENDTFENKIAACPSCNINKHSMGIEDFRDFIQRFVNSLNNHSTQYKIAKRYGLIKETGIKVKFYYEEQANS